MAPRLDQLPRPNAVLGTVSLPPGGAPGTKGAAIRGLVAHAYKYGCDALALSEVRHAHQGHRTTPAGANPRRADRLSKHGFQAAGDTVGRQFLQPFRSRADFAIALSGSAICARP